MARYEITNRQGEIDWECGNDFLRRTVQNAKNLITLRKGELPYDRQRGLDGDLYDLPQEELKTKLLPELDRAMLWEPDAEVVHAWSERMDGETVIHAVIEVAEDEA